MHIRRFGIRLTRLKEEHIEMVRNWRNSDEIRSFMEFQDYITPAMQQKWFHSLDRLRDFYFVIEHRNEPVGLIHTSGIDWKNKHGHSGLFVWKKDLLGSHVPVLASLAMVDFFFLFCTLEKLYAKVMQGNAVAVKYNAQLGFKPAEKPDGKPFLQYLLSKDDYFTTTAHLHEMAESVSDGVNEVVIENSLLREMKTANALSFESKAAFVTVVR
ncbi:MAG TPA: GNAT family N-acetyltransferase [Chitinophagales bacterium]|nr:GNAT family N-acetyltransferase [Chitinophagales bacterium]